MPGYDVRLIELQAGSERFRLRVLSDLQQFSDPDGHGARLGISCSQWSLFGQLWPAGELLAEVMSGFDIRGKRFLEIGCGIGAPSLVLQRRGADVVATDIHPQAEPFLAYNAALNGLPAVPYRQLDWLEPLPSLGRFDVLIASDVMYERDHARLLAGVVERHARTRSEVVVTDSGRGGRGLFTRLLEEQGFVLEPWTRAAPAGDTRSRLRVLHFRRLSRPMHSIPRLHGLPATTGEPMSQSTTTQTTPAKNAAKPASAPLRRGSGRSRAASTAQLTSQSIAQDIAEFKKRGGRIEVLGNTPLRPYASKAASRKTPARTTTKAPAGTAKKTGTTG